MRIVPVWVHRLAINLLQNVIPIGRHTHLAPVVYLQETPVVLLCVTRPLEGAIQYEKNLLETFFVFLVNWFKHPE